jgi:hypothetical protein
MLLYVLNANNSNRNVYPNVYQAIPFSPPQTVQLRTIQSNDLNILEHDKLISLSPIAETSAPQTSHLLPSPLASPQSPALPVLCSPLHLSSLSSSSSSEKLNVSTFCAHNILPLTLHIYHQALLCRSASIHT